MRWLLARDPRFARRRRACRPEAGGPSRPRAFSRAAMRALRPSGPRADRRSAFQAVPALFLAQLCAPCGPPGRVPTGGRRSKPSPRFFSRSYTRLAALRAACRPEVGVPSRPRDSSPAAIRALRPSGPRAGRRPAVQAVPAILRPQLYALRGPPGRVPAGGRPSKPSPRFFARSFTRLTALRAACRPEAGVPSRPRGFARAAMRGGSASSAAQGEGATRTAPVTPAS